MIDLNIVPYDIFCVDSESNLFCLCNGVDVYIADLSSEKPQLYHTDLTATYMEGDDYCIADFSINKLADNLPAYDCCNYDSGVEYSFLRINGGECSVIPFEKSKIKGGRVIEAEMYGDIMEIKTENGKKPITTVYQFKKK